MWKGLPAVRRSDRALRSRAAASPRASSFRSSTCRTRPRWTRGSHGPLAWGPLAFEAAGRRRRGRRPEPLPAPRRARRSSRGSSPTPRAPTAGGWATWCRSSSRSSRRTRRASSSRRRSSPSFAAVVLTATGVPGVLPLALLAALCDVIPVAGISVVIVGRVALGAHRESRDGAPRRRALPRVPPLRGVRARSRASTATGCASRR